MLAAVLMVSVPPAVEVRSVRVAVHVTVVAIVTAGIVHLAVLMIPMPAAIEMAAVGVAMHVPVMVAVTMVSIYVLGLMDNSILRRSKRLQPQRVCACRCERQSQSCTRQTQRLHP